MADVKCEVKNLNAANKSINALDTGLDSFWYQFEVIILKIEIKITYT